MPTSIQQYIEQLHDTKSRASLISLVIIVLAGFLLRYYLFDVGHAYHYLAINDEISAYEFAMRFLAGDSTTYYLGQPDFAGGKAPGPYFTLFWIAFYELGGQSPQGALFVILILNSALILLIYWLARCFLDNRYALLTALLFATAPWTIYYAVGLWNPMPLAILGAFLFISLWKTVTTPDSKAIFWVWIILALIPQFHMIGIFYAPAVFLVLYTLSEKLNRPWFVLGLLTGIGLYLPYLIGDGLNNWQNTRAILAGQEGDGFSFSVLKILTAPATVLSNLPSRWSGPEFSSYIVYGDRYFGSYIVLIIVNLLSILFSLYIVYSFLTDFVRLLKVNKFSLRQSFNEDKCTVFIGMMGFVPLILFLFTGHNYATRYTIIIFPLLFILFSIRLRTLNLKFTNNLINIFVVLTITVNIFISVTFFNHTAGQFEAKQQFMPSFKILEEINFALEEKLTGTPSITLAETPKSLSELNRTLLTALPSYINIQQKYQKRDTNQKIIPLKLFRDLGENPEILQKDIVYRDNGIILSYE